MKRLQKGVKRLQKEFAYDLFTREIFDKILEGLESEFVVAALNPLYEWLVVRHLRWL